MQVVYFVSHRPRQCRKITERNLKDVFTASVFK